MKNKVYYSIFAFIPAVLAIVLQNVVYMLLNYHDIITKGIDYNAALQDNAYMTELSERTMLLYCLIGIVIFGLWCIFGTKGTRYKYEWKDVPLAKTAVIFLVGIGTQLMCASILTLVTPLFPGQMDAYTTHLEDSGIAAFTVRSILVTGLLAPVLEEFAFRGVTIHFLRKAGYNFWAVCAFQAVLFGVFHMQLVQGIYATVIGFILGFLYYKYESVFVTIGVHIVVNCSALLINIFGDKIPQTQKALLIMLLIGVVCLLAAGITAKLTRPSIDTAGYEY